MRDLTVGKEGKQIFYFALPLLLSNLFQQLYNVVDTMIIGNAKGLGTPALAAVGNSFPVIFTVISFVVGIAMGGTIMISQYFGAKDYKNLKLSIETLNIFLFFAAIVMSVLSIIFSEEIFRLMDCPEESLPMAIEYFNIYMGGLLVFFGFHGVSAILRGIGDAKTPLVLMIIATFINIGLDLLFVFVFGWGIKGVAYATIIAQGLAFGGAVLYLNKNHEILRIKFTKISFDLSIFKKFMRIGVPAGMQSTFVALGMILIMYIVNQFGGDQNPSVVAAYSVAHRIDGLAMMPAMNFAMALSTFVGQNIGANKLKRVKKGLIATLLMSSAVCVFITLMIVIFGEQLMELFTRSHQEDVVRIGKEYLVIVSSFYLVFNTMFNINGVLRGAGDTFLPMFITLISLWIVRIPLAFILSGLWTIHLPFDITIAIDMDEKGIWWAIPIAWFVGLTLAFFYYLTGRWKKMGVVKQKNPPPGTKNHSD